MQHRPVRQRLLLSSAPACPPACLPACLPVPQADRNLYEALSVLRFHFNIQCNERLQAVLSQSGLSVEWVEWVAAALHEISGTWHCVDMPPAILVCPHRCLCSCSCHKIRISFQMIPSNESYGCRDCFTVCRCFGNSAPTIDREIYTGEIMHKIFFRLCTNRIITADGSLNQGKPWRSLLLSCMAVLWSKYSSFFCRNVNIFRGPRNSKFSMI